MVCGASDNDAASFWQPCLTPLPHLAFDLPPSSTLAAIKESSSSSWRKTPLSRTIQQNSDTYSWQVQLWQVCGFPTNIATSGIRRSTVLLRMSFIIPPSLQGSIQVKKEEEVDYFWRFFCVGIFFKSHHSKFFWRHILFVCLWDGPTKGFPFLKKWKKYTFIPPFIFYQTDACAFILDGKFGGVFWDCW